MKIDIHELTAKEFDEAIEWYELQSKGLGKRFKKSIMDQLKTIKKNPGWFLIESDNIHKAYAPKFPYKILYTSETDRVVIWSTIISSMPSITALEIPTFTSSELMV